MSERPLTVTESRFRDDWKPGDKYMTEAGETWPVCGYCKDCKWWTDGQACELVMFWGRGCSMPNPPVSLARVVVEFGYDADLKTEPEFGCVQWEEKE